MINTYDDYSLRLSIAVLPIIGISIFLSTPTPLLVFFTLTFLLVFIQYYIQTKSILGYANLLTLGRGLAFFLLVAIHQYVSHQFFSIIAIFLIFLDHVDGTIARYMNDITSLGSFLDLETDSATTLLLLLLHVSASIFNDWLIIIAILRYVYIIVLSRFKQTNPDRRSLISGALSIIFQLGLVITWTFRYFELITITSILGVLISLAFIKDFLYKVRNVS